MAAIKMDELLVSWLGSDMVYEKVLNLIETHRSSSSTSKKSPASSSRKSPSSSDDPESSDYVDNDTLSCGSSSTSTTPTPPSDQQQQHTLPIPPPPPIHPLPLSPHTSSPRDVIIPPFYTPNEGGRGRGRPDNDQSWDAVESTVHNVFAESAGGGSYLTAESFLQVTKDVCRFPSFFNQPLYRRVLAVNGVTVPAESGGKGEGGGVNVGMFKVFWEREMEGYDANDRFFRLVKQMDKDYITRDDFLPFIEELLVCHPGLEFLQNHAEFQEKYAVTVITRIFYSVNTCHNGKITARQIRKSDLLSSFHAVDDEEDINKITRYFSYEHFYVLYCRFWELDHDRDYRITREDLLKYGEHSLSHLIVDRIFDAAPRPFESSGGNGNNPPDDDDDAANGGNDGTNSATGVDATNTSREYLSYEDFIFFMLSEEDKANEISVRYWFTCIDVDGDGKLNNMEMRSFYAVQLHRMQCLGHEIVPFEDMLCQMIDMIKPNKNEHFVVEDFLQPECALVSGALFDALFNLNKYLQFEQRDPFMERQKREDEFESDWDRFACIDYNRLAMEEEAREEEAMEIDWVTVDDDEDDGDDFNNLGLGGASEAPF